MSHSARAGPAPSLSCSQRCDLLKPDPDLPAIAPRGAPSRRGGRPAPPRHSPGRPGVSAATRPVKPAPTIATSAPDFFLGPQEAAGVRGGISAAGHIPGAGKFAGAVVAVEGIGHGAKKMTRGARAKGRGLRAGPSRSSSAVGGRRRQWRRAPGCPARQAGSPHRGRPPRRGRRAAAATRSAASPCVRQSSGPRPRPRRAVRAKRARKACSAAFR